MNVWVDVNGWPVPPIVLFVCLVAEILYVRGWRVLLQEEQAQNVAGATALAFTGSAHGTHRWDGWFWRGMYFLGAIFIFLVAASAPIDILSNRLFWVHMVQHLLLLVIMAPLLVAGAPLLPMWLGLPERVRKYVKGVAKSKAGRAFYWIGHWLRQPAVSCILLVVGVWVWHWPPLYDFALTHDLIHDWCEHLSFQAVSILFWTQVIPSPPLRPRLGYLGRIGCLGFAIAQNVVLAALLGFAQSPLYAPYAQLAAVSGGLTALQDQQFGAGIMWTFGDFPFLLAFSVLIQQWLVLQSDETSIALKSPNVER